MSEEQKNEGEKKNGSAPRLKKDGTPRAPHVVKECPFVVQTIAVDDVACWRDLPVPAGVPKIEDTAHGESLVLAGKFPVIKDGMKFRVIQVRADHTYRLKKVEPVATLE